MPPWHIGQRHRTKCQRGGEEAGQVLKSVGRVESSVKIHSGIGNIEEVAGRSQVSEMIEDCIYRSDVCAE